MSVGRRFLAVAIGLAAALIMVARAEAATPPQTRVGPKIAAALHPLPPATATAPAAWPNATFQTIDVPGAWGTQLVGVNDSGVVGGNAYTDQGSASEGFIDNGGQITEFNYPNTTGVTSLDGMNNHDTAVGTYVDSSGTYHGWIRTAKGTFTPLDDPLAATGAGLGTFPEGINREGEIVGFYTDAQNIAHGFVYTRASGFTTLDVPAAGTENGAGTVLVSVNSSGVITSTYLDDADVYHGAIISHGSFFYFDAPGAGTGANQGTIPYGITRKGLISGWTLSDSNGISGWLLHHWQFTPLNDPLGVTGPNLGSAIYGINAQGSEAAGEYWDASGTFHGYVATLS